MAEIRSSIQYSRAEFYDLVWSTPTIKLAKNFGLSDVGLAKICKKHRIPKPPLGYWAMLQHGKKVKQTPLPKITDGELETIRINPKAAHEVELSSEVRGFIEAEAIAENLIIVPDKLISPHPLIRATKAAFNQKTTDSFGRIRPKREPNTLNLSIGPNSIERAMKIMDALLKALEKRNFPVRVVDDKKYWNSRGEYRTEIVILGEPVEIRMEEPANRSEVDPKEKEKEPWLYYSSYKYVPSGCLNLIIESYVGGGLKKTWADTDKHSVETRLNSFICGLILAAESLKKRRLEKEEQDRMWAEAEKIRADQEEKKKQENLKIKDLLEKVNNWHESQKINIFLDAAEATQKSSGEKNEKILEWIIWARRYADSINPLSNSHPPSK